MVEGWLGTGVLVWNTRWEHGQFVADIAMIAISRCIGSMVPCIMMSVRAMDAKLGTPKRRYLLNRGVGTHAVDLKLSEL